MSLELAMFVSFGILFLILSLIIVSRYKPESQNNDNSIEKSFIGEQTVNGVKINITEEDLKTVQRLEEKQLKESLEDAQKKYFEIIQRDRDCSTDIIRKKVLDELLKKRILSIDDLIELDFLYNDGKLRTNEEVEYRKRYIKYQEQRDNFDKERHKTNFYCFFLPFLIGFAIGLGVVKDVLLGPVVGLLFGLSAGLIGSIIGYSSNINAAKEYCIPNDDPRVLEEINKRRAAVIASVTSSIIVGHHAKNTIKGVMNPDTWSEMK